MKINTILGLALLMPMLCLADTISLSLNTAPLTGSVAGPFFIDFQFVDGSGIGDANNTVNIGDFVFGGGGVVGLPELTGGAAGSLSSQVSMTDSSFFNEFTQEFTGGSSLSFQLNLTTNVDAQGVPDEFSFAILDNTGVELPTQGLAVVGSDVFLDLNIDSATNPSIQTFASDIARSPAAGGPPIEIASPTITMGPTAVPEPSALALTALFVAGVLLPRAFGFLMVRRHN